MAQMEFEWDPRKARINLTKHGISFPEAATVFGDPLALTFFDPDHSIEEERYITFWCTSDGTHCVVAHTDRKSRIRILSARRMTRRERKSYEEDQR